MAKKDFNKKRGRGRHKEPKEYEEQVIKIDRVTRVVKGGRKLRFRATVVIGNRKGKVGIGIGKSHEVTGAIQKAIAKAKKNIAMINLHGATIPHDIKVKYKAAKISFLPAAPGTGIIAGGPIRKILELAGVSDILSKSYGTTNKINNTRATFKALKELRVTPAMKKAKAKANANAQPKAQPTEAPKKPDTEMKKPEVKAEEQQSS